MERIKTTLKIKGISCGMCEARICEVIRRAIPSARKVTASRRRGEAGFLTDTPAGPGQLKEAIAAAGYTCLSVENGPPEKKSLFGRK